MEERRLSTQVKHGLQHVKNGHTVLQLNYQGLRSLPSQLFSDVEYTHIRRIHLKRNRLKRLPDAIGKLTNLVELYLHSNDIEQLPESIGELKQLESLDLSNNNLTKLTPAITRLERLTSLVVSNNNIQSLPSGMHQLKKLAVLDLMNNHLKYVPAEVIECRSLQRLALDRNQLTWLPKQLCHMLCLEELSVAGNNLLSMPADLGNIPTLKTVYVDNNRQLSAVPLSIQHCQIGFNSCGTERFSPNRYDRNIPLMLTLGEDDDRKVICLPPELLHIGSREKPIPSLLELTLRKVHQQKSKLKRTELPVNLQFYLREVTASCSVCQCPMLTSTFPMIYAGQIHIYDIHYLGLCCSVQCLHFAATRIVQLPLVYPDLGLQLVLRD